MRTFVYLMQDEKPLTGQAVTDHVDHLRALHARGALVFCGPFADHRGGLVVFRAESREAAESLAASDPFIAGGFKRHELREVQEAHEANDYLLT